MKNKGTNVNPGINNNERFNEVAEVKGQSIQELTGASAEEIRKAIEKIGFDRAKVEEYLKNNRRN